jgi:hypothetical protein
MAEAAAARPRIVGQALNEIAKQDPELLDTVLEVMEVENLLASGASIDILPNSSNVLIQLGERMKSANVAKSTDANERGTAARVQRDH